MSNIAKRLPFLLLLSGYGLPAEPLNPMTFGISLNLVAAQADAPGRQEAPELGSPEWIRLFVDAREGVRSNVSCANPDCPDYNWAYLKWSPSQPFDYRCPKCGTHYPSSAYPEDKHEERNGVSIEFHLDADGQKHYFPAHLRYERLVYAVLKAGGLADAARKGHRPSAVKVRDIMMALARVLPDFRIGLAAPEVGKAPRGPSNSASATTR